MLLMRDLKVEVIMENPWMDPKDSTINLGKSFFCEVPMIHFQMLKGKEMKKEHSKLDVNN